LNNFPPNLIPYWNPFTANPSDNTNLDRARKEKLFAIFIISRIFILLFQFLYLFLFIFYTTEINWGKWKALKNWRIATWGDRLIFWALGSFRNCKIEHPSPPVTVIILAFPNKFPTSKKAPQFPDNPPKEKCKKNVKWKWKLTYLNKHFTLIVFNKKYDFLFFQLRVKIS
jgi:hypothetical protein